jgi:hypothetical protein
MIPDSVLFLAITTQGQALGIQIRTGRLLKESA